MDELYEELTKFVNENRKAFESAEQWLGQFDGNYDAAWEDAQADLVCDWKKLVFVTVKTLEKGKEFMLNRILAGEYITSEHPNLGRIRKALEQGKKELALDKNKPKEQEGQELHMIVLGKDKCNRGQSVKLLEQIINDTKREGVTCTERAYKSFRKFFSKLGYTKMLENISHDTKTKKVTTTISVGKLFISK